MLPVPHGVGQSHRTRPQKRVDRAAFLAGESAAVAASESTPELHLGLRGL